MTEGSSVRVHRVDAACDARPLPGMVRPPTLLCVPGLKESRSGYRVEDRDVVHLCPKAQHGCRFSRRARGDGRCL